MRKSKVVSITLDPELLNQLDQSRKITKQNRSEAIKNIIVSYYDSAVAQTPIAKSSSSPTNLAFILKQYYNLISQKHKKILVVGLGMVIQEGRVLIGKRKHADPLVKHLTWVFPGGQMNSLNFQKELATLVDAETGLTVRVGKLIDARIHPDNFDQTTDVICLYFHCSVLAGEERPGGYQQTIPLTELKWVKPTAVTRHFTTSTSSKVMNYLKNIELSSLSPDGH